MCCPARQPAAVNRGGVSLSLVLLELGHACFGCKETAVGVRWAWLHLRAPGRERGRVVGTKAILQSSTGTASYAHTMLHTHRPYLPGVGATYGQLQGQLWG